MRALATILNMRAVVWRWRGRKKKFNDFHSYTMTSKSMHWQKVARMLQIFQIFYILWNQKFISPSWSRIYVYTMVHIHITNRYFFPGICSHFVLTVFSFFFVPFYFLYAWPFSWLDQLICFDVHDRFVSHDGHFIMKFFQHASRLMLWLTINRLTGKWRINKPKTK